MKTILYNPIFINPQAYYVFPRLTRYLQPDNESTAEPANYIGTIEVKVIAYGDTTLKRTYTNTDSIDLSEFKNTWIRISLFTKVGSCVLGEWKIGNMESDLPYIDPEVLASLKAVVIVGNKTNNDSDRAIVKNLVDADNPFVISNAAFKLNSGFGKYEQDFTDWKKSLKVTSFDSESIKFTSDVTWVLLYHPSSIGEDIPSFKVRIKLYGEGTLYYNYITQEGKYTSVAVKSEIFETPICYNTKYIGEKGVNVGFTLGVTSGECSGTITQIPSFEGAFVTDGVDDLITSTKTVQEMLGGSNELTIVSMVHQVKDSANNVSFTNYIRGSANGYFRNIVNNYDKTGIYGYTSSDLKGLSVVNNILGDKNDYTSNGDNRDSIINGNFSVQGYSYNDGNNTGDFSSVAWYWTIIANKVLTTDQINQVIAYFNLDRTLKPDILCDVKKQGITNENHAEFGDRLIDFSGNGRDIQLNNIAWKGDSGIGKYEVDFLDSSIWNSSNSTITSSKIDCKNAITHIMLLYYSVGSKEYPDIPSFKVIKTGADIDYSYIDETGSPKSVKIVDGMNILPASHNTLYSGSGRFCGFGNPGMGNSVTITQIPSHAGALCLDGVNDYGKVTGMPVYKDYTIVVDYERLKINIGVDSDSPILSKSESVNLGAFMFNTISSNGDKVSYSFGRRNIINADDTIRKIFYQSKYINDGQDINIESTFVDSDKLWLGTYRDSDYRFIAAAIYSLMSFPYSMSEFLIERQLKKHKLGTLYPDMVEFRPVIKTNVDYTLIKFYINNYTKRIYPGDYIPINTPIQVNFYLKNNVDELISFKVNGNDSTFKRSTVVDNAYNIVTLPITESPQKIDITIDEYIRFEDIVQPYPAFYEFTDENRNLVTWGSKIKVGSTITRIKAFANSNLLKDLYNISYPKLNGVASAGSKYVVERQMVFTCTATYLLDDNEPKCILSPSRLRIPNSSYKILGYIPDISGHGNHGVIHNSAYALNSGANGYPYDYRNSSFWSDSVLAKVVSGELIEYFAVKNSTGFSNITSGVYKGEIKVTGVTKAISENKISRLRIYTNSTTDNELIDITQDGNYNIDIKGVGDANRVFFYAIPNNPNESIVVRLTEPIYIEQVGEYEGAYCLDGVDDYISIPTLVTKQSLIKCNWTTENYNKFLLDYRKDNASNGYSTNKTGRSDTQLAYNGRVTYIDGILNKNLIPDDNLKGITHCAVIQYPSNIESEATIASAFDLRGYMQMALYTYIAFSEFSTEEKIKELNEYVGIEGNTE